MTHMAHGPLAPQGRVNLRSRPYIGLHQCIKPLKSARIIIQRASPPLAPCRLSGRWHHRCEASAISVSSTPFDSQTPTHPCESNTNPLILSMELLKPDAPLVVLTMLTLLATVFATLAFPLAIGDIFDVVRQHLASISTASTANSIPVPVPAFTTSLADSLLQTVVDVRAAAVAAPPAFHAVLLRLCICLVLSAAGNAAVAYLAPLMGERFGVRLRKRLMKEILSKNQSFFDGIAKGDLVSRLTLDVATLQATITDCLGQRGIRSILEVVCSLTIIATKNPLLALVSLAVTPALSAILRRVVVHAASLTYKRQQAAAAAMEFATDRLTHVRTVQLFAQEDREAAAYAGLAAQGYVLAGKGAAFQGIVEGAGRLAVNIGTLSLLGLGGALVLADRISLGTLLAFQVYNLFLSVGLASVAASVGDLGKALGAMERVAEVVGGGDDSKDAASVTVLNRKETVEIADGDHESRMEISIKKNHGDGASVEFRDVWFQYPGRDDFALQGMSLRCPAGATVALVGPSGGGKSTVAALMLGMYRAQRGEVLIDDVALNDVASQGTGAGVRAETGVVLQQPSLLSGTVADQLRLGAPHATHEELQYAAKAANAHAFICALPDGYATEVGERGHTLSGGEKQRISLARALVRKPRLLILDEPTAALDVDAERAVDGALHDLEGCTQVIIAHRLSTVRRADSIAVIHKGRVVEQGSHEELMAAVPESQYRRMVLLSEFEEESTGDET